MDGLRDVSVANYQAVAAELAAQTQRTTVQTALAWPGRIAFVILLSAWLSIHSLTPHQRPGGGHAAPGQQGLRKPNRRRAPPRQELARWPRPWTISARK
ncbi:MAG: hypothetical protein U1E57_01060 [Paenacidovorax caeni]